jgi:hypothetical protein
MGALTGIAGLGRIDGAPVETAIADTDCSEEPWGMNFVRPDRVITVQMSATGSTVIVIEGGARSRRISG